MKAFITRKADGEPEFKQSVTGVRVGPFCVHRSSIFGQRDFVCTHASTGFSAFTCDNKKAAIRFAKELAQLPVDWGFDDPDRVKTFPDSIKETCKKIVLDASRTGP